MMSWSWSAASMSFFFFNDTATTEIYTLSLHAALPIYRQPGADRGGHGLLDQVHVPRARLEDGVRSEEHTSELQSRLHLVCRPLLEKKKKRRQSRSPHRRHCAAPRARTARSYA